MPGIVVLLSVFLHLRLDLLDGTHRNSIRDETAALLRIVAFREGFDGFKIIKDLDELPKLIGHHVFVRLKHPVKKMLEITGDLLEVKDGMITLSYRDKALTKEACFEQSEIEFARLAVRI